MWSLSVLRMCSVKTFGLSRPLSVLEEHMEMQLYSSKSHRIGAFKLQLRVGKEKQEFDFLNGCRGLLKTFLGLVVDPTLICIVFRIENSDACFKRHCEDFKENLQEIEIINPIICFGF